jgi:hypothetical protein
MNEDHIDDLICLTKLRALDLTDVSYGEIGDLRLLTRLAALTRLNLAAISLSNFRTVSFVALAQLAELRALYLDRNPLGSPRDLRRLTALTQLTFLSLKDGWQTSRLPQQTASVVQITTLQHLDMSGLRIGRAVIAELRALPALCHLEITVRRRRQHGLEVLIGSALTRLVLRPDRQRGIVDNAKMAAELSQESAVLRMRALGVHVAACGT